MNRRRRWVWWGRRPRTMLYAIETPPRLVRGGLTSCFSLILLFLSVSLKRLLKYLNQQHNDTKPKCTQPLPSLSSLLFYAVVF